MSALKRIVVPVASSRDAVKTCTALEPYLEDVDEVIALHVIETAKYSFDKSPRAKRRDDAEEMFDNVRGLLGGSVDLSCELCYGEDVVETIIAEAVNLDATGIALSVRPGGRIVRIITGDMALRLVSESPLPVISLPRT